MLFNRFEWDEHTLSFRRAVWGWQGIGQTLRYLFLWSMIGGSLLVLAGYPMWERLFLWQAEKEKEHLLSQQKYLLQEITATEDSLAYFYNRAEKLYRPLLGLPSLPPEIWEGHMGGAPITPVERPLYKARLLTEAYQELSARLHHQVDRLLTLPCIVPVLGPIVSGFGYRTDPLTGVWQMHTGLDISAPYGTPVQAAAPGKVRFAGWDGGGYGLQVEIDHGNGLVTKYAHLSRIAVQEGEMVSRRQVIGYVGSTGYSVGPHLHYEVIERGTKVDPRKYLLLP
ncbi:MAG: M23 family metallopeptidase [Bacteroidia bacterium]|jgi:murein DD-endopeptidase MepM/ murein hydrolase activator NlpD|nr:M23 family metallopeptidase [Bacteroidia bacterium]GIV23560.1 MAG: hypothetical protein KatS3mg025_1219 [Bacteroidia bacterium]